MIFHSDPKPSYWEMRRELDIEHDRIVEEFAQRDREWDRKRKEITEVARQSLICFNIVSILSRKGYIPVKLWIDFATQEGWTAYLPIECGPALKKIWEESDPVLLYELYKSN